MQSSLIHGTNGSMPDKAMMPMINGRPNYQLADALTKVSPQAQTTVTSLYAGWIPVFM